MYGRDANPAWPGLWLESLADISPEILRSALRKLEQVFVPTSACPFPVPGNVRSIVNAARDAEQKDQAESAWHRTLEAIERQNPDLGWKGPALDARCAHAARAAGGWLAIWNMTSDKLVWAKKAFTECHLRDNLLEEAGEDAPRTLQTLVERAAAKMELPELPAAPTESEHQANLSKIKSIIRQAAIAEPAAPAAQRAAAAGPTVCGCGAKVDIQDYVKHVTTDCPTKGHEMAHD